MSKICWGWLRIITTIACRCHTAASSAPAAVTSQQKKHRRTMVRGAVAVATVYCVRLAWPTVLGSVIVAVSSSLQEGLTGTLAEGLSLPCLFMLATHSRSCGNNFLTIFSQAWKISWKGAGYDTIRLAGRPCLSAILSKFPLWLSPRYVEYPLQKEFESRILSELQIHGQCFI